MTTTSPSSDLSNRVCLVTGATSGIGYVTALELARRGATVALVARNQQRAEQKPARSNKASYDQDTARRLWTVSEQHTGVEPSPPSHQYRSMP